MELEVGKFVRTKDGTIGKIIAIDLAKPRQEKYPNHPSKRWWRNKILISCYKGWRTTQNIIKASYNIIDILEVGDVIEIDVIDEDNYPTIMGINFARIDNKVELASIKDMLKNESAKLLTVTTHEQMEQMAYKVEK